MSQLSFTRDESGFVYCDAGSRRIGWYFLAESLIEEGRPWAVYLNLEVFPDLYVNFVRSESAAKRILERAADEYKSHPRM